MDPVTRDHVSRCAQCQMRIEELQATRRALRDIGAQEVFPEHNLAQRAVGRLRIRQTAIGNVNEIFAALRALVRGFAELFGGGPPPADAPEPAPRRDGGIPHG